MGEPKHPDTAALPDSRLYTFIDEPREFALYFLEGQRLIQDVALIHAIQREGFAYFRDVVLSIQPLIALLKSGEQLGFYIDSSQPQFRLKLETGHHGATRCVLYPDDLAQFPQSMHGLVRLQKLYPRRPPYESVLQIDGLPLREIVNQVLETSYQANCTIIVSRSADQSALLHQLPPLPGKDEYDYSPEALQARRSQMRQALGRVFRQALLQPEQIEAALGGLGFRLLASRVVRFQCSCSRTRMVENLRALNQQIDDSLFDPGQTTLQVTCEYCKTGYSMTRQEVEQASSRPH